ncbi:MAG: proliferating cell nuclear antigen (pcna) [Candidatus Methanomethylicia archaeon]|uniref:DNA polymerase sliding clamp n=1 Tax=Candidatus Methanomethylicus mesodigestus TaxID=1867258 RepID=A0A7C3F9P8_9CREN|nr:proliferating cell nuclear antigen (pcna) [Candidatus Methanomethylicia archaeon]
MFKAVLADSRVWKSIIDSVSTLVEEGAFIADPSGIKLRAMDPSRVAMVDLELPKAAFEGYDCSAEMPIGVNFEDMKNIMKRAGSNEKLELEKADEEARLKIRFRGKTTRTFSLPLLDLGKEELSAPRIPFNVSIKTPAATLLEAIRDAEVVSDFVKMTADQGVLKVRASGDRGEVDVEITKESGELLSIEMKEPAHALYSLSYLTKMMVASALSEIATLMFSTDMPLRLDFNLSTGGKIVYYLAPRMESD